MAEITNFEIAGSAKTITKVEASIDDGVTYGTVWEAVEHTYTLVPVGAADGAGLINDINGDGSVYKIDYTATYEDIDRYYFSMPVLYKLYEDGKEVETDFNEAYIKKNIEYGYFDTLKAFGKCVGGRYYIDTGSYYKNREFYSRELLEGIEKAAEIFGIELFKIYTVEELISKVTSEYRRIPKYDVIPKSLKKLNEKSIYSISCNVVLCCYSICTECRAYLLERRLRGK